jgi:hypothetical protein
LNLPIQYQNRKWRVSKMSVNLEVLRTIANANAANSKVYVSKEDGLPLVEHAPPLIRVDPNDASDGKVAAYVTEDGAKLLNGSGHSTEHTKPVSSFSVQSGGLELPKVKRGFGPGGGGGAPTKYPFETMNIGEFFFVANTEVTKGDAFKTMGSAVGSANQRFSEVVKENGVAQTKQVERAKRGPDHKAIKDPATGKNVMETVTVDVTRPLKKFVCRAVEAGQKLGDITSPVTGAVIARVKLPE